MKSLLLLSLSIFLCSNSFGQDYFIKNHDNGSTRTHTLLATSDSMYVQVGVDDSDNMFVIKSNRLGDTLWLSTYGGAQAEEAIDIVEATTGGYVIVGNTESFGAGNKDIIVLHINEQGVIQWAKSYGGVLSDEAYSIINTSDNGYLISGRGSANNSDALLIKIDANGAVQWERTYTNIELSIGNNVIETSDNGYLITGKEPSNQLKVVKLDNSGQYLWSRTASAVWQFEMQGVGVFEMSNGDFVVFGDEQGARLNIFVIRFNAIGNIVWGRVYRQSASSFDHIKDAVEAPDGGIIISTIFEMNKGLAKLSSTGSVEWARYYWNVEVSSQNYDYKGELERNWAGGYVFTSDTESGIISTDSIGQVPCYGASDETLAMTTNATWVPASAADAVTTTTVNDITTLVTGGHSMSKFEMNNFPDPGAIITSDDCTGVGAISLNITGGVSPYQVDWNSGCSGMNCSNLFEGVYEVGITDTSGCAITEMISVPHEATTNEICVVTVDPTSQFVKIIWEAPVVGHVEGYNIYRYESGSYSLIGSRDYDSTHVFEDMAVLVNPNQATYRYKIAVYDSCGYESELSSDHRTILCGVQSVTATTTTVQWNHYEGASVDYYRIYRDDFGTDNWVLIDSVLYPYNLYVDNYYHIDCHYRVEANTSACTVGSTVYNGSLSNSAPVQDVSISEASIKVQISPNPVKETLHVVLESMSGPIELTILNLAGQKVKTIQGENSELNVNVSDLPNGMYQLVVEGSGSRSVKKFVKF